MSRHNTVDHGHSRVHLLCTTIIALNQTIRDGVSYVSCLSLIPEEGWLLGGSVLQRCVPRFVSICRNATFACHSTSIA